MPWRTRRIVIFLLFREAGEEKEAITAYHRLAVVEVPCAVGRYQTSRYSLVAARPHTGRRHQLRRHFKHLFHPIIGDTNYGEGRHNRFFRETFGCARLLLHAAELSFRHPFTREETTLTAGLGDEFTAIVQRLGWRDAIACRCRVRVRLQRAGRRLTRYAS